MYLDVLNVAMNNKMKLYKAYKLWRQYVTLKYSGKCAVCSKTSTKINCHHLISRQIGALYLHPCNGILLCPYCHKWSPYCSPHEAPLAFIEFLIINHPDSYEFWRLNHAKYKKSKPRHINMYAKILENLIGI